MSNAKNGASNNETNDSSEESLAEIKMYKSILCNTTTIFSNTMF